jgi:hypothetical protein
MIEYVITAITTAKTTMQMMITNQKSGSMRSASFEAGFGSQGRASATAAAIPPATIPIPISDAMEPLRIRPRA